MKRTVLLLTIIIAAIALIWIYPATSFTIDANWWIVCYSDQYDIETAELVQDAYGGTILDLEGDHDFNAFGQSFIFVGGSRAFAEQAPWAEEWPPELALTKPSTQPDVKYVLAADGAYITTPEGNFYVSDGDYGYITKAYDYTLRRWIVICIGWSAECTAAGARIIVMQPDLLQEHSWIVYEWHGGDVALNEWSLQAFSQYSIVESG